MLARHPAPRRHTLTALSIGIVLTLPLAAEAGNGYMPIGYGTKSKGMGGVAVALPQDSLVVASNPAGMAYVSERFDIGIETSSPASEYADKNAAGTVTASEKGKAHTDYMPGLGYNGMLDAVSSVGLGIYGNNTSAKYATAGEARFSQIYWDLSYAQRLGRTWTLGGSIFVVGQGLSTNTVVPSPGFTTNYGIGGRLGALLDIGAGLTLGAMYQPAVNMKPFTDYVLVASAGDFDVPARYAGGLAWKSQFGLSLGVDYEVIKYSAVNSWGRSSTAAVGANGFGWKDANVLKAGAQYTARNGFAIRAGLDQTSQVIPNNETAANKLWATAAARTHATGGLTFPLSKDSEVDLAFIYTLPSTITGAAGAATTELTTSGTSAEVSYGVRF